MWIIQGERRVGANGSLSSPAMIFKYTSARKGGTDPQRPDNVRSLVAK
jgi:hypothetical protein